MLHVFLFSAGFAVHVPVADAAWYYVPLPSIWYDHDLQFKNNIEALRLQLPAGAPLVHPRYDQFVTPTGHVADWFSIGPALTWAIPFVLVAYLLGPLGNSGTNPVLFATVDLAASATFLLGMYLCTFWLARRFGLAVAASATAVTWVLSPLLDSAYTEPGVSHVPSATFSIGFLLAWEATRRDSRWSRYLVMGIIAGLAMTMRWQNVILLVFPIVTEGQRLLALVHGRDGAGITSQLRLVSIAALGTLIGFAPQMVVWWIVFGSPVTMPQGSGFMHWLQPEILSTWFASYYNGVFTWEPLAAVGLAGLVLFWKRDPALAAGALVVFALQTYVNASAGDWFGGGGFGPRRFDSLVPVFALGVGVVLVRLNSIGRIAAVTASAAWMWVHWVLLTHVVPHREEWLPGDAMQLARESFPVWTVNIADLAGRVGAYSLSVWKDPGLAVFPGSPLSALAGIQGDYLVPPVLLLLFGTLSTAVICAGAIHWLPRSGWD